MYLARGWGLLQVPAGHSLLEQGHCLHRTASLPVGVMDVTNGTLARELATASLNSAMPLQQSNAGASVITSGCTGCCRYLVATASLAGSMSACRVPESYCLHSAASGGFRELLLAQCSKWGLQRASVPIAVGAAGFVAGCMALLTSALHIFLGCSAALRTAVGVDLVCAGMQSPAQVPGHQ